MEPPHSSSAPASGPSDARVQALSRLMELTTSMLNIQEIDSFLQRLAETVSSIFGFEHVSISTFEEEKGMFYHHGLAGYTEAEKALLRSDPEALSVDEILVDFREDCRLSSISFFIPFEKQNSPASGFIMVKDSENASSPRKAPDMWHPLDLMYFQLKNRKGDMIGYMQVDYPKDGKIPKLEAIREMELYANLAAVAIDNSKMFQRTRAYLDLLSHDVGNLITPVGIYLDVVMNTQGITPLQRKYLTSASEAAKTITKLVADVRASALPAVEDGKQDSQNKGVGRLMKETPSAVILSSGRSDELLTEYMMDILAGILKVEPLDVLLHKIARVISENFHMNRVVVGVRDEVTGDFCEKVLFGYPADASIKGNKRVYPAERMKYDLRDDFRIGHNTYYVRPLDTGVVHSDDHSYSVNPEFDYVPRGSPQDWQQLDYIDFVMTDKDDNWIGWIEIDDPADKKVPSKEVLQRIRVLSDLAAIAIENSSLYEKALGTANEATGYLDMIVRGMGTRADVLSNVYSQLSEAQLDSVQTEALENARQEVSSILDMVRDVKRFTEIRDSPDIQSKELVLKDLLEESARSTKHRFADREVEFELNVSDEDATIKADKYAKELFHGLFEYCVKRAPRSRVKVQVTVHDNKDSWRVVVDDNGPQIPNAEKESMFRRLGGRQRGALGKETHLAIATMLVQRYRGTISVRDRTAEDPSQGASYEVTLPKAMPLVDWMKTYQQPKKKGVKTLMF